MSSRFRQIGEDDLQTIMNWRMSPEITKYMCSDPKLTIEDQKAWFERIKVKDDALYWVFEVDGEPAGLVSLVDWDKKNSIVHPGAYIARHEARSLQNIIDMNMNLFGYAIEKLQVNRLTIEIMSNNVGQLKWILRFGASKDGVLRQAIQKNGEFYDLHIFSILSSEWADIKHKIRYNQIEIEEKL